MKANIREGRKNIKESKERNRALEINIIKKRAKYFEGFLKRTESRGVVFLAKWKDIELEEYTGSKQLYSAIDKIRSVEYNLGSSLSEFHIIFRLFQLVPFWTNKLGLYFSCKGASQRENTAE